MSFNSDYSLSDIAAVTGNNGRNDGDMFGGNGAWWIIILFLFVFCGWGGNGFGGNGGRTGGGVMEGYVLTSDFANLERKLDNVNSGLCDGFYAVAQQFATLQNGINQGFAGLNTAMFQGFAGVDRAICNLQAQIASCCCEIQRQVEGVRYEMAIQAGETRNTIQNTTRDLLENSNANTRAILDKLNAQEMAAKDAQIAAQNQQIFGLQLRASQEAQNTYLVNALRPCPTPAYITCNPWATQAPYGGCNPCNTCT